MESLPQLVLDLVFEFLVSIELSRASLVAFASSSWTCRAAAWHKLFSRISIDVDTSQLPQRLGQPAPVTTRTGRTILKPQHHDAIQGSDIDMLIDQISVDHGDDEKVFLTSDPRMYQAFRVGWSVDLLTLT